MIVKGFEDIAACGSQVVDFLPTSKTDVEGTLLVGDRSYDVTVTTDEGLRVWPRVIIRRRICSSDELVERAALEVCRRGMADPAWAPLCIDPRDGETLYSTTFTCDFSAEALDRFLTCAKEFLERNHEEVDRILAEAEEDGNEDDDGFEALVDSLFD